MNKVVLACDPSFTGWGWSIICPITNKVFECGCIKTKPEHKKQRIRVSDDRVRRINEIVTILHSLANRFNIQLIVSEAPHGSQSAVSAVMIGISLGIMQTFSQVNKIPIEWYSENDAKKSVTDTKKVSKDDMIVYIANLYEVEWNNVKWKDEGIADSLAIYHCASKSSPIFQILRND